MYYKDALIYDYEVGTSWLAEGVRDNTPHNPNNMLVSIHYCHLTDLTDVEKCKEQLEKETQTIVVNHNEIDKSIKPNLRPFLNLYGKADVVVAHNNKFDEMWSRAMNFPTPVNRFCTMICEYILARGQTSVSLSLEETVKRYKLTEKKSDLTHEEFKDGKEYYEISLQKVIEYGEGDIISTGELFLAQLKELEEPKSKSLQVIVQGANDLTDVVIDMELNGIKIDREALNEVEQSFQQESDQLDKEIKDQLREVMGDRPYKMTSGPDTSKALYSRDFINADWKKNWKHVMNLGTDAKGKQKYQPRYSRSKFANYVKSHFKYVYREIAHHCHSCNGTGMIRKTKKDGTPYKNLSPCPRCDKEGVIYEKTNKVAGFKLVPFGTMDASVNGFKTDKKTLEKLIKQAQSKGNLEAASFLTKVIRKNAVDVYLNTFIKGINLYTRTTDIIHPNFNQVNTATGRLSSSSPNWQNMPKGNKFPVRKAVVSRFEGGEIWESDYSQLEFRGAGELSRDPVIIQQVKDGFDVHRQTASIINKCKPEEVTKEQRGQAKATTFSPLYGGRGAFEPEHIKSYFEKYFEIYQRLGEWHKELFTQALDGGVITTPTGRQFKFNGVVRTAGGRVSNATNICNYPVQSFSTADCVPRGCVNVLRMFREAGLKSKLIITVHDSIVCDVHPEEKSQVLEILKKGMRGVSEDAKTLWNFEMLLPLDIEVATGKNWMEIEEIPLDKTPT